MAAWALAVFSLGVHAQNRCVAFEPDTLVAHALDKARSQGKLVMVDCYTQWCVPCKALSKLVFTVDSVADFINGRMVSVKLDMETPQGKDYLKRYQVGAFPTILFLNPDGSLHFKFTGYVPADEFMRKVREGLQPANRVASMNARYAAGERGGDFIRDYIMLKMSLSEFDEAMRIDSVYLQSLSRAEAASPDNWLLFGRNPYQNRLSGPGSMAANYLFAHYADFKATIPADTLSDRISDMCCQMAEWVLHGWFPKQGRLQEATFTRMLAQLQTMDVKEKINCMALITMCRDVARGDTVAVGKTLLDHVETMDARFQDVVFSYSGYGGYAKAPFAREIAAKVIKTNRQPHLVSFMRSIVPDAEPAEKRFEQTELQKQVGTLFVVPFFHPEKRLCWWSADDADGQRHHYAYDADARKTWEIGSEKDVMGEPPSQYPEWGVSPDSLYRLEQDGYNIAIVNRKTGGKQLVSHDGTAHNEYSVADTYWYGGHSLYTMKTDSRKVRTFATLSQLYTTPTAHEYQYETPGDTCIATQDIYVADLDSGDTLRRIDCHGWKDDQLQLLTVKDCPDKIFFIRRKRTRDIMELCAYDLKHRTQKTIVREESKPIINEDMFACKIVNKGDDIFFWSDRSGWGHYYHYDGEGKLLNAVTNGDWTAGHIVEVDEARRQLYFYGYGRERGFMPHLQVLYRVDFNGKNLRCLTPENRHHQVFVNTANRFMVDNSSRIDCAPVVVARDMDGTPRDTIFTPDISRLLDYGWKMPETFTALAADGKTPLYGIMWKPFDFDASKRYPIISQVYPGPFTDTVWQEFTVADKYDNTALAQRGFIVVCFGHRGSSPYRSAAYYKYGHGNLRDYALADDKAVLEQLGGRHAFIDLHKVGIVGHSGGAMMAATALMTYPDLYKAAVASSGNYDNHIYNRTWGESYQGIGEDGSFDVPTVQELAGNLKGHLLLVTGDADQNVHPAHTMRLANALIMQHKDFDMLVLPNQGHHYELPYELFFQQKKRDFLARWLK